MGSLGETLWGERTNLDSIIHPILLYGLLALGGVGVGLALPSRGTRPQVVGGLLAAVAAGLIILVLTLNAGGDHPVIFFYIFGIIALGAALRVITHSRPVYAALWFIMVVLASSGLLLLLSAEFMTMALVIVYAGAILITYLFVIMLATQAPEEDEVEVLLEYDTTAREPIAATVAGFVLLAVLTTLIFRGLGDMPPAPRSNTKFLLAEMPRKVESVLNNSGLLKRGEKVAVDKEGQAKIDWNAGTIEVRSDRGETRLIEKDQWPENLTVRNVEALGFSLLRDHPGTIEIAGVILLMAMLGATVLSRKQVQMDDEAKMRQAKLLSGHSIQPEEPA